MSESIQITQKLRGNFLTRCCHEEVKVFVKKYDRKVTYWFAFRRPYSR